MRRSTILGALLDGVNVGALGLMAGVVWQLGRSAIVDPLTTLLAIVSAKVNSAWLVAGGALIAIAVRWGGAY